VYLTWGATAAEVAGTIPGDLPQDAGRPHVTHAISIAAPPESVWPWLVQIGHDRGGFYSYASLENAFGLHVVNADRVHPEWQHREAGDWVPSVPDSWLGGRYRQWAGWRVGEAVPPSHLVLEYWGTFALLPVEDGRATRFVIRSTMGTPPVAAAPMMAWIFEPAHWIMQQKMMRTIRDRAEGREPPLI
jgi:hypothetical protein